MLLRLSPPFLILLCLLLPSTSWAEQRWYQIEVIVAERLSVDLSSEGHQAKAFKQRPSQTLKPYPQFGSQALVERPQGQLRLTQEARRLRQSGQFRTLFHKAWPVALKDNRRITWVAIEGGEQAYNRHRLEGNIGISLGRFLHFFPRLTLTEFKHNKGQQALAEAIGYLPFQEAQAWQQYQLGGTRKMRSKELHYIDHPKLVVLVRIDPFAAGTEIPLPAPQ